MQGRGPTPELFPLTSFSVPFAVTANFIVSPGPTP